MVLPVSAAGLGVIFVLLVAFVVGYGVTYEILEQVAKRRKSNPTLYRDTLKEVKSGYLTEERIQKISLVGGAIAIPLAFILLIAVLRELGNVIWYVLIAIGILCGLSTFVLFGSESNSKAKAKSRPTNTQTRQKSERERQKHRAGHQASAYEAERKRQESERERQRHRAEYRARVCGIQRKEAEKEAIKDDLYSLFGIADDQSQRRGKLLKAVLNRFFNANDIRVREAFELVEQEGSERERTLELIDGVIEIDGCSYLVEMKWWKEPLGTQEVSPHLVRVFNRGYPGGILMTKSGFTQSAITTCQEALSQKTVILCELEEIVTLLEWNGSLKDFLKAKIAAAAVDKNPLFKPLDHPREI